VPGNVECQLILWEKLGSIYLPSTVANTTIEFCGISKTGTRQEYLLVFGGSLVSPLSTIASDKFPLHAFTYSYNILLYS
jgi:hypothetical protein